MRSTPLDVFIIGAGPIGLACGIEASKAGFQYLIADKGCLVNSLYNYPYNMTFFSTADRLEIGNVPFISHQPKPNRMEALEYYRRVASSWKLNVKLYEGVTEVSEANGTYIINTTRNSYAAKNIIIATGFYDIPNLMGIPGESLPKVHHYYKEPHPYFGQKIAVVGAANSAVDVALETFRKGAEVTMIVRNEGIGDNVKYWVRPDIVNRLKEGTIKGFFHSELMAVREREIDIKAPEGVITIENDFVLAMTGYMPDFSFLEKLGIRLNADEMKTPSYNPDTMETNKAGIYLAGVICGGMQTNKWFIENSRVHAEMVIRDLQKKKSLAVSR